MLHDPTLSPPQGGLTEELDRMALVHLEDAVERLESARPGAERC